MQPAASQDVEPYMPQWQSESVPAELPNHVVNRLMMGASLPSSSRHACHPLALLIHPDLHSENMRPLFPRCTVHNAFSVRSMCVRMASDTALNVVISDRTRSAT